MSRLNIRFGKGSTENSLDFSNLENNPRFNAEPTNEQEPQNEPTQDNQEIENNNNQEVVSNQEEPTNDTQENIKQEEVTSIENKSTEDTVDDSSLNNQESQTQQVEVTDELLFKHLSEKLGKEINSIDDLTTTQAVELDSQVQALNEWKKKTGKPIEDFFKFQRDFTQVSDIDIAREFLQLEYPTFNQDEINLELERFLPSDDDLDIDTAKKALELKKYAIKGRNQLESLKADLGEPSSHLSPEIKEQLDFAKQVKGQIETQQQEQEKYVTGIKNTSLATESLKLNLSDDLSIDFKLSNEQKNEIPKFINEMSHWRDENGEWNHQAVVNDSIKLKYFDQIIKLVLEQGSSLGEDKIIKEAKNTTLGNNKTMNAQNNTSKKPIIENLDKILGKSGLSIKFGK